MNKKHLEFLVSANKKCFGKDDEFSSPEKFLDWMKGKAGYIITKNSEGKFNGYLFYHYNNRYLEIIRRGSIERESGVGKRLTKKAMKIAESLGLTLFTYAHKSNLASINSSVKSGLYITKINDPWVELQSEKEI